MSDLLKTQIPSDPEAGHPADAPEATTQSTPGATAATEPSLRPFFTLWTGQSLSLLGSQAVQFALIWWLTEQTGSAAILSLATLLGLLPPVVLGPLLGALVDRWNRKAILFGADAFVAAVSAALAFLFVTGSATPTHVLVLLFARALGAAFHQPAMMASTTLMVPADQLTKIQGLNQALQGLMLIVAAPLGAVLLAALPMAGIMLVDVGTALIGMLPLLFVHVPQPNESAGEGRSQGDAEAATTSVWTDLVEGFRYLGRRTGHVTLVALSAAINLCVVPAFALLPLFVLERLAAGPSQLAWVTSMFGVGLLVGGTVLGAWGGFARKIVTTLVAMVGLGAAILGLGLVPPGGFGLALAAAFGVGFMVPLINGPVHAILQATIAPELQGRVFALVGSLAAATAPVGMLLGAPIAAFTGVGALYVTAGIVAAAMGLLGFAIPALMRIEEDAADSPAAPQGDADPLTTAAAEAEGVTAG